MTVLILLRSRSEATASTIGKWGRGASEQSGQRWMGPPDASLREAPWDDGVLFFWAASGFASTPDHAFVVERDMVGGGPPPGSRASARSLPPPFRGRGTLVLRFI